MSDQDEAARLHNFLNQQLAQVDALTVVLKQALGIIALSSPDPFGTLQHLKDSSVASARNLTAYGPDKELNELNGRRTVAYIEEWFRSVERGFGSGEG